MKIAIASDIYYPMTNGVAVFAKNLAEGLSRAGHEVMVIVPSFKGRYYRRTDPETGVINVHLKSKRFPLYPDQIERVPDKKRLLGVSMPRLVYKTGIWFAWNPYDKIEEILNEFQPDVIHLQTAETIALAIMRYQRKYDVPLVSTGHAYPDNITGQFKALKPVKRPVDAVLRTYMASFLKHSEYATMPTEMAIDDLVPQNRKRFKVTVEALSNGIDLKCFKPGKPKKAVLEKYGVDASKLRVMNVGRVDPEKSIDKVILAFEKVVAELPEAELLIVGDGIAKEGLVKMVAERGLEDNVKFAGRVMLPDLVDLYRSGAVFATASETETQGIVLIEAAACGLPLVAVDAGAVKELCQDGRNGVLCEPGDVEGFAAALVKILKDGELRERYGTESLAIARRHDIRRTLARFEEIYRTAIEMKAE
ncbi:glycosyltransferase [Candidatus Saccharibacteria bacterium]|nr:glycosyltransferase [Candidatus Saccharibacteria bacterium]